MPNTTSPSHAKPAAKLRMPEKPTRSVAAGILPKATPKRTADAPPKAAAPKKAVVVKAEKQKALVRKSDRLEIRLDGSSSGLLKALKARARSTNAGVKKGAVTAAALRLLDRLPQAQFNAQFAAPKA